MKKLVMGFVAVAVSTCALYAPDGGHRRKYQRRESSEAFQEHEKLQKEFMSLQEKAGMKATAPRRRSDLSDKQMEFNKIRASLNAMLSKDTLSDADVKEINMKIDELDKLNPYRFPKAKDYRELLAMKIGAMKK